jgi:GR25 family glycosyltransferase involved in LPS biosynthesis
VGCAISHITVWEDALKNNYENILVLEEDFQVLDRFLVDDFKSLPSDWDLFYLGKNTLPEFEDIETELPRIKKSAPSYNSQSYLLSSSGIKKLLSKPFKQNLFPVDEFFIATYLPHPNRNDLGFIESDVNAYTLRDDLHICKQTSNFKTSATENIHKMNKLHPELYSFHENLEAWIDRFITYSAKTKEWDLISDEPFDNFFSFPLFTSEFCTMVREEAEYANSWTVDRHANYPTTDMLLDVIGLHDVYMEVLRRYVMPFTIYIWGLEGKGWDNLKSENFLAKYTPEAQGHLSIHHDSSDITCLVQLSDTNEYEGGGTWFKRQKKLIKNSIGYCGIHPGNITHKHGARAVTSGARYIIVSFMNNLERY